MHACDGIHEAGACMRVTDGSSRIPTAETPPPPCPLQSGRRRSPGPPGPRLAAMLHMVGWGDERMVGEPTSPCGRINLPSASPSHAHTLALPCADARSPLFTSSPSHAHTLAFPCVHARPPMRTRSPSHAHTIAFPCAHARSPMRTRSPSHAYTCPCAISSSHEARHPLFLRSGGSCRPQERSSSWRRRSRTSSSAPSPPRGQSTSRWVGQGHGGRVLWRGEGSRCGEARVSVWAERLGGLRTRISPCDP